MINVRNLHKRFDRTDALDGIDLTINRASIYGLVGTNGAGKTTLIRHMAGILKPDEGEILFDGEPILENTELKQKIGLVPDELYFPKGYAMKDMVKIYSGTYDSFDEERLHELTKLFRLDETAPLKSFSKGMKKQAVIALVLASKPDYLLLDEPIDGLDPIIRKLVWKQIVDDVAEREMTVLVSSHNLRDLESICDYVGIIDNGKTVMERDLESIREGINKV
nr:ABC transporter ATP-binding protein [Clostridia bacterium]